MDQAAARGRVTVRFILVDKKGVRSQQTVTAHTLGEAIRQVQTEAAPTWTIKEVWVRDDRVMT